MLTFVFFVVMRTGTEDDTDNDGSEYLFALPVETAVLTVSVLFYVFLVLYLLRVLYPLVSSPYHCYIRTYLPRSFVSSAITILSLVILFPPLLRSIASARYISLLLPTYSYLTALSALMTIVVPLLPPHAPLS
ncbi:hypothetical protein C8R46DRAFT_1066876 [Mycena filopes]|nr:hypothetical protein C8R46DRAFT_1066876 [Mycena filopes]